MTTRLDVLNGILDALGEPVTSSTVISSSTPDWVKRAERQIDKSAKYVLEAHPWNFATTIEQLQQTDTAEPLAFQYEFHKSANCLRICKVTPDGGWYSRPIPYEDRAGKILTNSDPSYLHFVDQAWLELLGSWPEHFAKAVEDEAAWRACKATTQSESLKETLDEQRKKSLAESKTFDGQQAPAKPRYPGSWVRSAMSGWRTAENG